MFKNMKIATKILSVILIISLGALSVVYMLAYSEMLNLTRCSQNANIQLGITASAESEEALLSQAEEYLGKLVVEQANSINSLFAQVETEILASRDFMEALYAAPQDFGGYIPPSPDQTEKGDLCAKYQWAPTASLSEDLTQELKLVSNIEYMFDAISRNNTNLDNLYLGTESGISYRYSRSNTVADGYDPRERGWYLAAQELNYDDGAIWLDTYVSNDGAIVVTCCAPFFSAQGKLLGVVSTDITLSNMNANILNIKIGDDGSAFLLDDKGQYIVHPDYEMDGFNPDARATATGEWSKILTQMSSGTSGLGTAIIDDTEVYVAYAPFENVGWVLCVTVPTEEIIAPSVATKDKIDSYTDETEVFIYNTLDEILSRFIILFVVCAILLIIFSFLLSGLITKPLKKLMFGAKEIGGGNLDLALDVDGKDEISMLVTEFNTMTKRLKAYVENSNSHNSEQTDENATAVSQSETRKGE